MNDQQLLRYSRQIMLPDIDIDGQQSLLDAHVLIIGMGGLGCPIAQYLAAAGVGKMSLCDDDTVELSNLQRQILHHDADIGKAKVQSAAESIRQINPSTHLELIEQRFDAEALATYCETVDLVIDGSDNFATRFLINQACVKTKTPAIFGAAVRLEGQITVYDPRTEAACYACVHGAASDEALNCATSGVAAPVVGIIGSCQAMEAIKLLCDIKPSSSGYLQIFDAKTMSWNKFKTTPRINCPACSS